MANFLDFAAAFNPSIYIACIVLAACLGFLIYLTLKNKNYPFFHWFWNSINPSKFKFIKKLDFKKTSIYLVFAVLVFTLVTSLSILLSFAFLFAASNVEFPVVIINGGSLSSDIPQPHYLDESKSFVLDTTGSISSLSDNQNFLITNESVFVRQGDGSVRTFGVNELEDTTFDQEYINFLAKKMFFPTVLLFIILIFAFLLLGGFILSALAALLSFISLKILKSKTGFIDSLKVCIFLLVPLFILQHLLSLLNFTLLSDPSVLIVLTAVASVLMIRKHH